MEIEISKTDDFWHLTVNIFGKKWTFTASKKELSYEQITDIVCNLCKFKDISIKVDFTTRH